MEEESSSFCEHITLSDDDLYDEVTISADEFEEITVSSDDASFEEISVSANEETAHITCGKSNKDEDHQSLFNKALSTISEASNESASFDLELKIPTLQRQVSGLSCLMDLFSVDGANAIPSKEQQKRAAGVKTLHRSTSKPIDDGFEVRLRSPQRNGSGLSGFELRLRTMQRQISGLSCLMDLENTMEGTYGQVCKTNSIQKKEKTAKRRSSKSSSDNSPKRRSSKSSSDNSPKRRSSKSSSDDSPKRRTSKSSTSSSKSPKRRSSKNSTENSPKTRSSTRRSSISSSNTTASNHSRSSKSKAAKTSVNDSKKKKKASSYETTMTPKSPRRRKSSSSRRSSSSGSNSNSVDRNEVSTNSGETERTRERRKSAHKKP
jgi:hypothetical protein